jgi:hypothetical protein
LPIPEKVKLDVAYLQRQSLWFDVRILWLTFVKVLRRDGGVALKAISINLKLYAQSARSLDCGGLAAAGAC